MTARAPITLAQVAKRAGVHVSTVSRALAADPHQPASPTAERVRAIAAEMGYRPDPNAASLRTGRSQVLGVMVPRLTDYVLARIYEGVTQAAREAGYATVVVNGDDDPVRRVQQLETLLARRVDGVVIGDARLDGDEVVTTLQRRGTPYVLVNRRLRGHPGVTTDDVMGGRLAGEHLVALGHREVAVIAGPAYASTCVERTHGFTHVFSNAGIGVLGDRVVNSRADAQGGYDTAVRLLRDHPGLTAIFAINDFAAIGAMGAAREMGRRVGEDIAIVGYNDIPLARFLPVPLTSVASPMFEMGVEGGAALLAALGGTEGSAHLLPPHLSPRESTAGVPSPSGN